MDDIQLERRRLKQIRRKKREAEDLRRQKEVDDFFARRPAVPEKKEDSSPKSSPKRKLYSSYESNNVARYSKEREDSDDDDFRAEAPHQKYFRTGSVGVPKSVGGSADMKASPSSSVSFSQSPAVAKRKRAWRSAASDSSSSGEDPVELCKRLARMRAARGEEERPPIARKKSAAAAVASTPQEPKPSTAKTVTHSKFASRKRASLSDDSDESVDLVEIARQLQAKRKAKELAQQQEQQQQQSTPSSSTNSVQSRTLRNPLAIMAENNKKNDDSFKQPPVDDAVAASLWQDSEEEREEPKAAMDSDDEEEFGKKSKKKKKKKERLNMSNKSKGTRSAKASAVEPVPDVSEEDIEELRAQLKPDFDFPKFGPYELEPLRLNGDEDVGPDEEIHEVPASICRYLPNYQQEGIRFMYNQAIVPNRGAILGDDMGLGKTVQVVALLAALLKKTGTGLDLRELNRRKRLIDTRVAEARVARQQALLSGRLPTVSAGSIAKEAGLVAEWTPILILAPPSILQNWLDDFKTWGYFSIALYQGSERETSMDKVRHGLAEVMVCPHSLFMRSDIETLSEIKWKIIIVDEFHLFKNVEGTLANNLREIRDKHDCVIIGLTGTLMQNNHKELWNLVDLAAKNYLGPWKEFDFEFSKSIKLARTKDANKETIADGDSKSRAFSSRLYGIFIRREKSDVLSDELPVKDERIVFCEPSDLQKQLYQHILKQPDFVLVSQASGPCDCGVNQKFFLEYQYLGTQKERIEYQRRNKHKIVTRGECCYNIPHDREAEDGIDPRALIWRQQDGHLNVTDPEKMCDSCPTCIGFAAMHVLYKLSSHAALLQLPAPPDQYGIGSKEHQKALDNLERAKVFIPDELLPKLPGGSYIREDSIMDDHFSLSGKMKVLDKLLRAISAVQGRVLLFSASTQALDLIQNFIRSEGYSHLRMDGSTATRKRKDLAREFNRDPNVFIFLLSTKAMGLGLNLTAANYVIIFDVEWNPSYDEQAQDRAYRIGQERDVKVFRLVSRGTIEELKYLRQVYKTQLKNETIVDVGDSERDKAARLFRGVDGDKTRKGELFGYVNLLKFKDGTFMNYASETSESRQYGVGVHQTEHLLATVQDMTEEDFEDIGQEGNVFEDLARRTATDKSNSDDESESVLGGESQVVMDICDRVEIPEEEEAVMPPTPTKSLNVSTQLPTVKEEGNAYEPAVKREEEAVAPPTPTRSFNTQLPTVKEEGKREEEVVAPPTPTRSFNTQLPTVKEEGNAYEPAAKREEEAVAPPTPTRSFNTQLPTVKEETSADEAREETTHRSDRKVEDIMNDELSSKDSRDSARYAARAPGSAEAADTAAKKSTFAMLEDTAANESGRLCSEMKASKTSGSQEKSKTSPRNVLLVGKTTNKIKTGKAGKTTFSSLDLPLPRKKKSKKS